MLTDLAVMSSDAINRYGFRMYITALEGGILQTLETGIPYLINHDRHRPVGWNKPFALFLEPGLTRQLSVNLFPQNEDEKRKILALHRRAASIEHDESAMKYVNDFKLLLANQEISDLKFVRTNCIAVNKKGIAIERFPEIFDFRDKEGLISFSVIFNSFDYLGQGIFKHKESDIVLFAHSYFRRSQSIYNLPNNQFLDQFVSLRDDPKLDLSICLDEDQIGYSPSFKDYMELEYVYGPKFNEDIASIKPGLVKHQHSDKDRRLSGITSTEILWEWDKTLYTFQLEEISDLEAPMEKEPVFHCRYVHSVYNEEIQNFDHFDGAIRTYPFEDMIERTAKNFKEYGKKSAYKKLFKVNKKLPISKWKQLVTLYLRGNSLLYEYFGFKNEIQELKSPPQIELDLIDKLVPFRIKPEEGLKMLVSYFPLNDLSEGRYIDSFDLMSDNEHQYKCVDFPILELKKALLKLGDDLIIPQEVQYIKCEDRYWNIPSIMHAGENSEELFANTITAMKNLFAKLISLKKDFDISITLGKVCDNKVVKVSAFGNIISLYKWLETQVPFPSNQKEFSKWLENQSIFLKMYCNNGKDTFLNSLVQFDGVLYIKRQHVPYAYKFDIMEEGLVCDIKLPEQEELMVNEGILKMVVAINVEKCECSDTGEDYFTSTRSKWLDDDLPSVTISQASPLALYWSN